MADSPALLSMAQQFSGLPMDSLIGGPLNAATKANAAMAMTQTMFMLNTCFQKDGEGADANYKPIMINMTLTRGVLTPGTTDDSGSTSGTSIQSFDTAFNLPLLTIVPLNSLAVETVDIGFEMQVNSSYSEDKSEEHKSTLAASADWEVKAGWGPVSVSVRGSVSYDKSDTSSFSSHYQKSNSAKYTVNVHAGQLPLPTGVTTIIQAFASSIEPVKMPAPTSGG